MEQNVTSPSPAEFINTVRKYGVIAMHRITITCTCLFLTLLAPVALDAHQSTDNAVSPSHIGIKPADAKHISLTIKIAKKIYTSGMPVMMKALFHNHGNTPVIIPEHLSVRSFFGVQIARLASTHKPTSKTRFGKMGSGGENIMLGSIPAGGSAPFWTPIYVGSLDDITIPGKYVIQLNTGSTKSNKIKINVVPPRIEKSDSALATGKGSNKKNLSWSTGQPVRVAVIALKDGETAHNNLPALTAYFKNTGTQNQVIRLCGNPLVDFQNTQVSGPDGFNGDKKFLKPKPHWGPIPNWKSVPLTAYGEQLKKKRPVKNVKWKNYILRPGRVYNYTIPVNIGCRFDMSVPGNYHVRLHLANSKIESKWTDVNIPH